MRSLSELSVRTLRRRPARFALTGAGAALGVAVLYAVLITSGATTAALDDAITGSAGDADVFVGPVGSFDATLPPALVDQVAALDGVESAVGSLTFRSSAWPTSEGTTAPVSRDNVLYVVGTDFAGAQALRPFEVIDGALPADGADEIVLARRIADQLDLVTGDAIALATPDGSHPVTVSGVLDSTGAGLGFQGTVGYTSPATAQQMFGKGDVITGVEVALTDGTDPDAWIDEHRDGLGESLTIQDADDAAEPFRDFITAISGALTLMSVIAVFVGGFLVFLTFSVAVAERTPTYGILRALGAQPPQIRRVVLVEAGVLGFVASLVGLLVGRLIAAVSMRVIESLLDLDLQPLGLQPAAAIIGVVVGVTVSLAAAWLPGRRASALGPVDAMREGSAGIERPAQWRPRALLLVVGIGVGLVSSSVPVRGLAALIVLLASVLLVPYVLQPVARVVGGPTSHLARGTGSIAVLHLVKERSRSAYTLALVMVVLAMLMTVAGANAAMSRSLTNIIERQTGGSLQVIAPGAFDTDVGGRLASVTGVRAVTPVQFGQTDRLTTEGSKRVGVSIIDPTSYFDVAGFAWVDGDDETAAAGLAAGGVVLLPDASSAGAGVDRGDVVQLRTNEGVADFIVGGTYAVVGPGFGVVAGTPDAARFGVGVRTPSSSTARKASTPTRSSTAWPPSWAASTTS